MFRFIHAADLHIDSPLRGLEAYEGAPAEQLRGATREAFRNIVALALEEAVDFVVLAGDLFDGKWPDMRTGLWTAGQFRRLEREGIPVYMIRGNHDAESRVRQSVSWPDIHYCRDAEPLPIVMDDALVNFDDDRAVQTLHVLFEIAETIQIIFLTCHQHVVQLVANIRPEATPMILPGMP